MPKSKRALDVIGAAAGLMLASPIIGLVSVVVRLRLGSPVLFRQERAGYDGRAFELLKFRTMTDERSPSGDLLPDADRLTPLGARLRSTSIDELPELVNVLRGDMSLVGPRPLPTRYLDRYTPDQARRHDAVPGLTGWAQVNGRNLTDWPSRLAMDVWYVENRTFWLDLRIIARTVAVVLRRTGVSAEDHATMEDLPPRERTP